MNSVINMSICFMCSRVQGQPACSRFARKFSAPTWQRLKGSRQVVIRHKSQPAHAKSFAKDLRRDGWSRNTEIEPRGGDNYRMQQAAHVSYNFTHFSLIRFSRCSCKPGFLSAVITQQRSNWLHGNCLNLYETHLTLIT